ncbi:MAG: hypothetical protein IJX35_04130 [Candidatus Methanomethylophilaceae archaeon]|nr:hypothetical protein [Candidatus Methanomethylophilaceae archaeon]
MTMMEDIRSKVERDQMSADVIIPVGMNISIPRLEDGSPFICMSLKDTNSNMHYIAFTVEQFETFAKELNDIVNNDEMYRENTLSSSE